MNLQPFDVFYTFVALRLHFTTDYDYFKYNKKLPLSEDKFEQRKDKAQFIKLTQKLHDMQDLEDLVVSNIVSGAKEKWVQYYNTKEAFAIKEKWVQNINHLEDIVKQEIIAISQYPNMCLNNLTSAIDGGHPLLLTLFVSDQISMETLIVFDDLFGIFEKWDKAVLDDVMYPEIRDFALKYKPFVKYDKPELRNAIKTGLKG
jgi:hypothetical protein